MLGLNVFAVGTSDESQQWADIAHLSNSLDKNDFLPKGYFVDEEKYSRKPAGSSTPLSSRNKSKSKYEQDLPLPGQTKRSRRGSMDLSSEEEDEDDNMEFDEDHEEQCTPPVNLSQSVRGSSASSFQPVDMQPSSTSPPLITEKKRKRAIDDRDDMQAQIEILREERLHDRAQSLAMYAQTNKRMDELQQFMMATSVKSDSYHDAIMNQLKGIFPLASLLPSATSNPLMIQGQTSKSMHSGDSSLAESGRVPPPPVVPAPAPYVMGLPSPILHPVVAHAPMDTIVVPPSILPSESFLETHASPTIAEVQEVDGAILGAQSATTTTPPNEDIHLMNVEPVELVTDNSSSPGTHTSTGCPI